MTRKPLFWVLFTIISFLSLSYFVQNYNKAFPALSIDIKMNREMALSSADSISKNNNWTPNGVNSAVTFYSERESQTFVEREGGGIEVFKSLFQDSLYYPYGWKVRYFEEKNPNELIIKFTPSGDLYGFYQKLSEDEPGDSLLRDSAFTIATKYLDKEWNINLDSYELVNESEQVQPSGRVDHHFVYQRSNFSLGEDGFLRLKLSVSGNRLTGVNHYIQVPEAFKRGFDELRSFNDVIAFSANMAIFLIYGLVGCIYGIFMLMRQRRVLWKGALKWGLGIAFIQSLMQINFLPMMWMEYDTASTMNSFMIQIILGAFLNFCVMGLLYTVSFIAAEGLSRKAFPNHIQFWRLFSSRTSNSYTVLGQSLGGYLSTGIFMFYALAFYTFAKSLGWWSPTDTEYDPNILAAYFPWLTSIAISLGAGFWEECLFRAVPIAGAALIGERYGKRKLFIGFGMVLQALIFGAAHANYPVVPAYARVVELMIPSFVFGFIYLKYGLLPGIIMHYAYDVAMISLQIFAADVPGIWTQRIIILFFLFFPIWVILLNRLRFKRWVHKLGSVYNRDWELPPKPYIKETNLNIDDTSTLVGPKICKKPVLISFAVIGFMFWTYFSKFSSDFPTMKLTKSESVKIAKEAFNSKKITFDDKWVMEAQAFAFPGRQGKFIWQTSGKSVFESLKGKYLPEPGWLIRYRLRDGSVDERAEEYSCWVSNKGVPYVSYKLPEAKEGMTLIEENARQLAYDAIKTTYDTDMTSLSELEASSSKKPNRMDWFFRFKDEDENVNLSKGECRVNVSISGDEVTNVWREVFIPEDWIRSEEEKNNKYMPFNLLMTILIAFPILVALVVGIIRWSKKEFNTSIFIKSFIFLGVLRLIVLLNSYSKMIWNFSTAKPFTDQLYMAVFSGLVIQILFMGLAGAVLVGITFKLVEEVKSNKSNWILGVYIGLLLSGVSSTLMSLYPQMQPNIGRFQDLNYEVAIVGGSLAYLGNFIQITLMYLIVSVGLVKFTQNWKQKIPLGMFCIALVGFFLSFNGESTFESFPIWIGSGIIISLLVYLVHKDFLQYNLHLIPVITATLTSLEIVKNAIINIHDGTILISIFGFILVSILGYFWSFSILHSKETV